MSTSIEAPYYPIIYVRGYAMTEGEILSTTATPYMGFNEGTTKIRQNWEGETKKLFFESPLIRLMKDYGYSDVYENGGELPDKFPAKSVVIHRYYDQADRDFGSGKTPTIHDAAMELAALIKRTKEKVCGDDKKALEAFKVYLVAHSMGGLVVRCFLQGIDAPKEQKLVEKVFTYATPHNGIEMLGMNIPSFLGLNDMNNFSRKEMAKYLKLPKKSDRVDSLNDKFDPKKFFCLVGTNSKDYDAALGFSRRGAGAMSDGLVRIENATVQGAPRAFVYKSHSGPYGIVNSEEGYQNMVRFFFGDVQVNGVLEVKNLPLPPYVQKVKDKDKDKEIRASYYFESTVSPRGALTYKLTERTKQTESAVFRTYDEMMKDVPPHMPVLFSVFLDSKKIMRGTTLVFSLDLSVSSTGYEVDGKFLWDHHIPGENLFRDTLSIRATPDDDSWNLRYNMTDSEDWGESLGHIMKQDSSGCFIIPLESTKGFKANLKLEVKSIR